MQSHSYVRHGHNVFFRGTTGTAHIICIDVCVDVHIHLQGCQQHHAGGRVRKMVHGAIEGLVADTDGDA